MDKETQARKLVNLTGEKIAELFGPLKEYLDGERFPQGSVRLVVMPDDTYVTEINGGMIFEHWIKILGKQEETKQNPDYWKKELEKCQGSPHYYYTNYLKYMGKTGRQVPVSEEVFNKQFETFINHGLQKAKASAPEAKSRVIGPYIDYNGGILVIVGPQGSGKTMTLNRILANIPRWVTGRNENFVERDVNICVEANVPYVVDGMDLMSLKRLLKKYLNLRHVIVALSDEWNRDEIETIGRILGRKIDVIECEYIK